MLHSGAQNPKLSYQVEKIKKIKKHFLDIPPPHPHISATGQLIKNRLDGPKTMPMVTLHVKFQVFMMIRLGCRVWWVGK